MCAYTQTYKRFLRLYLLLLGQGCWSPKFGSLQQQCSSLVLEGGQQWLPQQQANGGGDTTPWKQ